MVFSGIHPPGTYRVSARLIWQYLVLFNCYSIKRKKNDLYGFLGYYIDPQLIVRGDCDKVVLRGVSQKVIDVPLTTPCPFGVSAGSRGR